MRGSPKVSDERRTRTIGYVVEDLRNPFLAAAIPADAKVAGAGLVHVLDRLPTAGCSVLPHRGQLQLRILAPVISADPGVQRNLPPHRTNVPSDSPAAQLPAPPMAP